MDEDDGTLRAAAGQRRRREDRYETFIEVLYACVVLSALWGVTDLIVRLNIGFEGGNGVGLALVGWVGVIFVLERRGRLREKAWERERDQGADSDL